MSRIPLGSDHSRGWKGLNFRSARFTALYRCISRDRFTGPWVRYTCQSCQLEDRLQPRHNVGARVGFDFQSHGVALAPVVQLRAHRLQHRARLFFLQIKIAVAGNAERAFAQNFIAAIHPPGVQPDQVGERNEGIAIAASGSRTSRGRARGTVTTPM